MKTLLYIAFFLALIGAVAWQVHAWPECSAVGHFWIICI